jgi:hypothetical protein
MDTNLLTNPKGREMVLNALEHNDAWKLFCERHKEVVKTVIEAKIFDPKTSAEEREKLVNARLVLVESYTPEKILGSMQVQARTEVNRMEREANAKRG